MNRWLVESATHPAKTERLAREKGEAWVRYQQQHTGVSVARSLFAKLRVLDRTEPFGPELCFPNSDEHILTRIGEEGPLLKLDAAPLGPFGRPVTRIALPAQWAKGIPEADSMEIDKIPEGLLFRIGTKRFQYTRAGLMQ